MGSDDLNAFYCIKYYPGMSVYFSHETMDVFVNYNSDKFITI